jgi:tetratricopeptide (TPR) repeat protein
MPAPLQLRLIPAPAPQPVRAGYLPGTDVMAWLEEMARHPGARFFVAPNAAAEAEPGGLVIVPKGGGTEAAAFGPRVLPCGLEHGCVVTPATTRLDPLLTAEEATRLLTYPLYFFHPTVGLVAFEENDAITPEALIVAPLPGAASWLKAVHGVGAQPRLTRVMLVLPEDGSALFGNAGSGIGSEDPRNLTKNLSLTERMQDRLLGGAATVGKGMLKGLGGLAGMLGGVAGAGKGDAKSGGMMDRLAEWSAKQMEKLAEQREREIQRLMKLLETNPDMALRFAIPFGGAGNAPRGAAPPGGRLTERNPVFGARRGSGPADVWNFSDQTSWALQQKYRDLANRELAAGRFDRAAYIFAELLGDWHAAAGALMRGRRFQEAAQIYEKKLNNQWLAAKCLEEGGLLADAVVLYAALLQHEKCGDLLRKLGREREAVAAYQEALKSGKDRLHDARILFEKLEQHGLALAVLASGYPASAEARQCLEKQFEYLNRLNATDDARALAAGLSHPNRQLPLALPMAEMLHGLHQVQPDPEVQAVLARVALEVIGTGLANASDREKQLLELLPKFAPSDLLLKRDAFRFQEERTRARRRSSEKAAATKFVMRMSRKGRLNLPQGIGWRHLISRGPTWLATGYDSKTPQDVWVMGRGADVFGKVTSAVGWGNVAPLRAVLPALPDVAWLPFARHGEHPRYGQAQVRHFAAASEERQTMMNQLGWMPPGLLAVQSLAEGTWVLHENRTDTVDLSFYGFDGRLLRTHAIGWSPPKLNEGMLMATHGEDVFIAFGIHLVHLRNGQLLSAMELPLPIRHLSASARTQAGAVLASTGQEVVLLAPGKKLETIQLFSREGVDDVAGCFLADGRIAAGGRGECLIYSAYPHARQTSTVAVEQEQHPVAGYAAWGERGLGILHRNGQIDCYE